MMVCENLNTTDLAVSSHRAHAHYSAKGDSLKALIAELYGKITGVTAGCGGSMNLSDLSIGFVPNTAIVAEESYRYIQQTRKVIEGTDITVVAMSYMTIEALHAVKFLKAQGIHCELIDLRTIKPLDWETIHASIRKTGRLLVLDTGFEFCSVASEIIAKTSIDCFSSLLAPPKRLAVPDYPVLTSPTLATPMYTYSDGIVRAVAEVLKSPVNVESLQKERDARPRDVPGDWFGGPF
ncbi:pyruvate dehydrogenase [Coxiella burnetii]|nr:pyruvate dehydrogenase [Coxiella burnetii]